MTSSIYLKTNKDYNNVFSEDVKILKVGRSPEVSFSLPHLLPLTAFFSWGRNIQFKFQGGHMHRWGTCFETGGAYAHSAPRLRTPLLLTAFNHIKDIPEKKLIICLFSFITYKINIYTDDQILFIF